MVDLAVRGDSFLIRCDPNGAVFAPDFNVAVLDFGLVDFLHRFVPFRSAHAAASENVRLSLCCSRPCDRIPPGCTSATTFRRRRASLLRRCDPARIRSALRSFRKAHRDTIWHQLWTIGQCASELQRTCVSRGLNGHSERNCETSTDLDVRHRARRCRNPSEPSALLH
jgi:hypothetical protein